MRGTEDAVYVVAIFFTFVMGLSSIFILYVQSQAPAADSEKVKIVKDYFGISDEIIEKMAKGRLRVSLEFTGFFEPDGIIVRNSGDAPLSGFYMLLDNQRIPPMIAPDILFPDSYGIILLDDVAWGRFSDVKVAEINTKQGASLIIRK